MSAKNRQTESLCSLPLRDVKIHFTRITYSRTADVDERETIRPDPFIDGLVLDIRRVFKLVSSTSDFIRLLRPHIKPSLLVECMFLQVFLDSLR